MDDNLPEKPTDNDPNPSDLKNEAELRSIQNFAVAASIIGPGSLIFGGIPFNIVALIIGFIALWRITQVLKDDEKATTVAIELKKTCIMAIVGCCIAFLFNTILAINMYPNMAEAFINNLSNGAFSAADIPKGIETWG